MRRALLINSGLPVLFLLSTWMCAQQPAPQNNPQEQDQEPVTTLRKDVNVVNIFFNVKDKHSAIIPDLTKADFELNEDGKPQTIKYFSKETDLPLTIALLVDTSGSIRDKLQFEQRAATEFFYATLQRGKETYKASVTLRQILSPEANNQVKLEK